MLKIFFCHDCREITSFKKLDKIFNAHQNHRSTILSVDPNKSWEEQNPNVILHAQLQQVPAKEYFETLR